MSEFDRVQLLAQKVAVLQADLDKLTQEFRSTMNQVADAITGIVKVNKMFTITVDQNIMELRKVTGLDPATEEATSTNGESDAD